MGVGEMGNRRIGCRRNAFVFTTHNYTQAVFFKGLLGFKISKRRLYSHSKPTIQIPQQTHYFVHQQKKTSSCHREYNLVWKCWLTGKCVIQRRFTSSDAVFTTHGRGVMIQLVWEWDGGHFLSDLWGSHKMSNKEIQNHVNFLKLWYCIPKKCHSNCSRAH
jgi:hypothetical protein